MVIDPMLERFVKGCPATVMARATLEKALEAGWVDRLFEEYRERQYTRELLFSTTVELMTVVALGLQPSIHAAARTRQDIGVSLAALYDKINGTEVGLSRALVVGSAERLGEAARKLRDCQAPVVSGYQVRVIDGNHLPASEKRLAALRGLRGAALPGHSLVVYDPDARLVTDIVPCEDAYAQERTLVPAILRSVRAGQVWMADRNFSTTAIIFGIHLADGAVIIREHGRSPNPEELGTPKRRGSVEAGEIYEQAVRITGDNGEAAHPDRRWRDGHSHPDEFAQEQVGRRGGARVPKSMEDRKYVPVARICPAQRGAHTWPSAGGAFCLRRCRRGVQRIECRPERH
jgi:hypothetical protein